MSTDTFKEILWWGTFGGTVVALICAMYLVSIFKCHARWDDSPFDSRWTFGGGCQIEIEPGKWIPEDRYRATP